MCMKVSATVKSYLGFRIVFSLHDVLLVVLLIFHPFNQSLIWFTFLTVVNFSVDLGRYTNVVSRESLPSG